MTDKRFTDRTPGPWEICPLCDRASEKRLAAQITRLLAEQHTALSLLVALEADPGGLLGWEETPLRARLRAILREQGLSPRISS